MSPIPGTANIAHLEENMAAAKIRLTPGEWKKGRSRGLTTLTSAVGKFAPLNDGSAVVFDPNKVN
jgi:diketogulonate reductase-like aldo/keto reductase